MGYASFGKMVVSADEIRGRPKTLKPKLQNPKPLGSQPTRMYAHGHPQNLKHSTLSCQQGHASDTLILEHSMLNPGR